MSVRLTSLAHGGGCGCKLSPAVLRELLSEQPAMNGFADLLVGTQTSDDAAVWRLNPDLALVATTDFFMPVVDDPRDFGRIAATNALSDIYAMGAKPILALALVGMPIDKLPAETIRAILAGGAEVCATAGVPIAGGHSIDSAEPIYGLVALGLVHPDRLLRNSTASAGDVLILTKPLGVGVLSAALKQERLDGAGYAALIAVTTMLNTVGADLAGRASAVTDVTGFGLLGHALEMAQGSGLTLELAPASVPVLPGVEGFLRKGVRTGASARNWASYGDVVESPETLEPWRLDLLTDPQTSGGLLIAVPPEKVAQVLSLVREAGFAEAAMIGRFAAGPPRVKIVARLD
jgi:selenide,water dikinase